MAGRQCHNQHEYRRCDPPETHHAFIAVEPWHDLAGNRPANRQENQQYGDSCNHDGGQKNEQDALCPHDQDMPFLLPAIGAIEPQPQGLHPA